VREFAEELDAPDAHVECVRGAVAFLRHTLLPFARREEAGLAGRPQHAESAGLDHAFLAAEADALAAEGRALAAGEAGIAAHAIAAVRRRLHRIEAVLELHMARGEDEGLL
jgi:hypothetical protein